jgi:hypothetical protein
MIRSQSPGTTMRSTRQPLLVLAFIGTVIVVPALAQQPANYPPACDAAKVSKTDVERAHTVFLSGKQFLDESNYDKAVSYFNDAYSIDCSVHGILPIIATAYERKGDKAEAVRALEEYLRRAPNAPDREHVERRIKNLSDQLANSQPSAAAAVATTPPAASMASAVPAASSTSEPEPTGGPPANTPSPGGQVTGASSHSATPWVIVGIGGAATIAGGILLAVGASDISSASTDCGGTRKNCASDIASKGNTGITLETVGITSGVVGLAAVAGGLIWHLAERPESVPSTATFVSPVMAPGYAGVRLSGTL